MLRRSLLCLALGLAAPWLAAQELRFYLPQIPGIYELQDGQPRGLYVTLLQQMAGHAGVNLQLYQASRSRILQSLQHQADACTAVTLPGNAPPPPGMRYLYRLGQTQARLFSRPGDTLDLDAAARLPPEQLLVFGEGVVSVLQQHGVAPPPRSESLPEAVAMLQAGRVRVLFASSTAVSRLAPGVLEPGPVLGPLVSWFACSAQLPEALGERLVEAWRQVPLPRF